MAGGLRAIAHLKSRLNMTSYKFRTYSGFPQGYTGIKGPPAEVTVESNLGLIDAQRRAKTMTGAVRADYCGSPARPSMPTSTLPSYRSPYRSSDDMESRLTAQRAETST